MPIDFDGLVLAPAMATFARWITVYPVKSQPLAPIAYVARGVFSSSQLDIEMQDGAVFSDQQTTLGIRKSEFAVLPIRGDRLVMNDTGDTYWVSDSDEDGQGGIVLQLRKTNPAGDVDE